MKIKIEREEEPKGERERNKAGYNWDLNTRHLNTRESWCYKVMQRFG